MPRQNRVTPDGDIVAIPARGSLMGNRGCLIDESGNLVRDFERLRWISCTLEEVHGSPVRMDDPEGYTPLFFTDDAVALAAGHRPCGQCRREDYYRFVATWKRLQGISGHIRVYSEEIDEDLHARRMRWRRASDQSRRLALRDIPEGAFLRDARLSPLALLHWRGRLWPWDAGSYLPPLELPATAMIMAAPWHFSWDILANSKWDWHSHGPMVGK